MFNYGLSSFNNGYPQASYQQGAFANSSAGYYQNGQVQSDSFSQNQPFFGNYPSSDNFSFGSSSYPSSGYNQYPPQQDFLSSFLPLILALFNRNSSGSSTSDIPTSRKDLLSKVVDNFDDLKDAGALKTGTVGIEDVNAILDSPDDYSSSVVAVAKSLNANSDLINLADWVSNGSGEYTHDRTNDKLQYQGALDVLKDKKPINKAIDYLKSHFDTIADNGGNTTALERSDIETEITRLQDGTSSEQAIGDTLTKLYYTGSDGSAKRDLITVLANASGNNSSTNQTITLDGLDNLQCVLNR